MQTGLQDLGPGQREGLGRLWYRRHVGGRSHSCGHRGRSSISGASQPPGMGEGSPRVKSWPGPASQLPRRGCRQQWVYGRSRPHNRSPERGNGLQTRGPHQRPLKGPEAQDQRRGCGHNREVCDALRRWSRLGSAPTLMSDLPPPEVRLNPCEVPEPSVTASKTPSGVGCGLGGPRVLLVEGLPPMAVASVLDPILPCPKPARPSLSGGHQLPQDCGPDRPPPASQPWRVSAQSSGASLRQVAS